MKVLFAVLIWTTTISFHGIQELIAQEKTSAAIKFPVIKGKDLNGREVELPVGLPGDPTLVFVAFSSKQHDEVHQWVTWIKALDPKIAAHLHWIELPVLDSKYLLLKPVIDNGIKSKVTGVDDRARTISLYINRDAFIQSIGVSDFDQIYALVVDQSGAILKTVTGIPDDKKKRETLNFLLHKTPDPLKRVP